MSGVYGVETTVALVRSAIQSGIGQALSDVRAIRTGNEVATEVPRSYFIFEQPKAYQCPAVLLIAPEVDFQEDTLSPNHINAKVRLMVSVVVEDRDKEKLTLKAWRYQSALYSILHRARLTNSPGPVTLTVVVKRANFSPEFTISGRENDPQGAFRKEILLECEVIHRESDG